MELTASKPTLWGRVKAAGRILFGYDAVANTRNRRNRGLSPLRAEEIELGQVDRDRMISTLLDFKRNNPVVKALSRLRKTDTIGGGIVPQPATPDEAFNDRLTELWAGWSESPEVTGQMSLVDVQKEIADATIFYGDLGILLTRSGKIQLIEGTRIGNVGGVGSWKETDPNKLGVIVNRSGRPRFYHVGQRVNGSLRDVEPIPARDFILHFKRIRPAQFRGIPELASCVNALQDVDEYEQIEMISAKVSASLSAVVKKDNAVQFELVDRLDSDEQDTEGRLERFEPGAFHYLEPGEDISTISTGNRPNVDGIEFCKYHLRKVGAAVGIPVEFVLSTIGQTSFSASQGLVLQYQSALEEEQRAVIHTMGRVYRWKVARWIASNELESPSAGNPFAVRWQLPGFRWINRVAQVQSDMRYLQCGAMSLDDITSQFGYTAESVLMRKAQNIKLATAIADKFGIAGGWKELFNPYVVNASANFADLLDPAATTQEKQENPNDEPES
ncbi:MAG: hypothetical protein CL510_03395 [Actinobacteria bacterium]|nr:hypothetical protein [Actinomycetota bacterium]